MRWRVLLACFIIVFSVAFIGSLFTGDSADGNWYKSIQPELAPPNYVFSIVWNILFVLIAISLYFVWVGIEDSNRILALNFFGFNLILNVLWSYFYFYLQNPFVALIEIFFLWITIIAMTYYSFKVNKKAGYMLIPYLLWVSFAILLNWQTVF